MQLNIGHNLSRLGNLLIGHNILGTIVPQFLVLQSPALDVAQIVVGQTLNSSALPGSYFWTLGPVTETWTWTVGGVAKAGSYTIAPGDGVVVASVALSATSFTPPPPFTLGPVTVPAVGTITTGFIPSLTSGTTGDVFVSPTGNDANPGTFTLPKLTIDAAILANPTKEIKLRGGIYRQEINLNNGASGTPSAYTRISRYDTEEVIISGSEVLTGLTACVAGDAAIIGSIWNRADVFKVTLADSVVASGDPTGFFPREAGVCMPMACEFVPGPFAPVDPTAIEDWPTWTVLKAGDVPAANGDAITGYKNTAITDKYTQAEIEAMSLYQYGGANLTNPNGIASFDTANKIIRLTNTSITRANSAYNDRMLLQNIPKAMKPGYWAYRKNGDGTTTYYLWLNNAANATSGVEYAARVRNLNFGNANYIRFEGIIFEGTASANQTNPSTHHAIVQPQGGSATNQQIYNCWIRQHHRSLNRTSFGFYAWNSNYLQFRQSSISECYGMYGFHPVGNSNPASPAAMTVGLWVDRCKFDRTASTAIRIYGQLYPTVSHCLWNYDVGMSPHANLIDPKLFSHGACLIGLDLSGANGYLTFQDMSAFNLLACYMHGNRIAGDSRTAQDQNATDPTQCPAGAGGSFATLNPFGLWACNHFAPDAQDLTQQSIFNIGKAANTAWTCRLSHNIIYGPGTIDTTAVSRDKNYIIAGTAVGTEVAENAATAYINASIADFRIAAGSAARTMTRTDLSAAINAIKAERPWIPTSIFNTDINGDTIDWTNPPIGPAVNVDVNWASQAWLSWPVLASGAAVVGQVLGIDAGLRHPGTIVPTYQWLRSDDGLKTWNTLIGQTAQTYTVVSGDTGGILARDAWLNGKSKRRTVINSTVLASLPISEPAAAFSLISSVNGTQWESASFTLSDRPLLVRLAARLNTATATTWTVTVGAPGRAAGTGTVIPAIGGNFRSFVAISEHFIASPGTGTVTIQVTASVQANGLVVRGDYFDGATAANSFNQTGATAASVQHFRSTTKTNCMVAYCGARIRADLGAVSLTGCTQTNADQSGSASDDVQSAFGHETASSPATWDATLTGSSSQSIILGAVILESAVSA